MPNVTATVKIDGVDDAVDKAHELVEAIKKAKSLADNLALAMKDLEIDVDL